MHFTTESFALADRKLKSYTLQLRGFLLLPFFRGGFYFDHTILKKKWKQKYNATDVHEICDRYTRFIAISGSYRIIS